MKYLLLILTFLSIQLNAQDKVIPLWNNNMPNFKECGEKDVYEDVEEFSRWRNVVDPDITVYLPKNKKTDKAVLVIPGGAYWGVFDKWEGHNIAKWLNSKGITAFVLKYRLPHSKSIITRNEAPLQDAEQAMRIIRSHTKEWKIKDVGVIGFSAGGHLASTLGTHFSDSISRPDFMVLMYPVITMDSTFTHQGSRENLLGENPSDELVDLYSNEKQVKSNTPPTLLIHSNDDDVVPVKNSIEFYNSLQKEGIKSELHLYSYGKHGFSLAEGKGYLETWKDICLGWMF